MNPTKVILETQNTLNQIQENQLKHKRKIWWKSNWYWVSGAILLATVGGYYLIKKAKK